ncbi:hypothetical protein B0H13DRAFT_2546347 [Mycena leptocephala]|nr:hypothetical protein B0H13DRAFT_2546347 [Mycena leptocephala]
MLPLASAGNRPHHQRRTRSEESSPHSCARSPPLPGSFTAACTAQPSPLHPLPLYAEVLPQGVGAGLALGFGILADAPGLGPLSYAERCPSHRSSLGFVPLIFGSSAIPPPSASTTVLPASLLYRFSFSFAPPPSILAFLLSSARTTHFLRIAYLPLTSDGHHAHAGDALSYPGTLVRVNEGRQKICLSTIFTSPSVDKPALKHCLAPFSVRSVPWLYPNAENNNEPLSLAHVPSIAGSPGGNVCAPVILPCFQAFIYLILIFAAMDERRFSQNTEVSGKFLTSVQSAGDVELKDGPVYLQKWSITCTTCPADGFATDCTFENFPFPNSPVLNQVCITNQTIPELGNETIIGDCGGPVGTSLQINYS